MHKWAIPVMCARHIVCDAFDGNIASVKVFLKNGFQEIALVKDATVVRGKVWSLRVVEWRYSEDQPSLAELAKL
jgi:RimJ/RimL family protein N-acetyltransferase